jgi:transposase
MSFYAASRTGGRSVYDRRCYRALCGNRCGKKVLAVCIMTGAADAEPEIQQREYSTFNRELGRLRSWLIETGCTHVVMESTGSYWRPVFEILEASVTVILANPEQVKSRRATRRTGMMPAG